MIYLDTHVAVWLYAGKTDLITDAAKEQINAHDIFISPIVRLELQYLYEIHRITVESNVIVSDLSDLIGLKICEKQFNAVINNAFNVDWTRDPFDRIIVANAAINSNVLITKDQSILDHYPEAVW